MATRSKKREPVRYREQELSEKDVGRIRQLRQRHAEWGRSELARRVCQLFDWRRPNGEYRTRSCLELLCRMEQKGWIELPVRRHTSGPRKASDRGWQEGLELGPTPGWESRVVSEAALEVRPIVAEELLGWRAYVQRYHYLGDCVLVGESLRYVAMMGGELVGLLSFSGATLHNRPRDEYVGWSPATKAVNRIHVVNNTRFLILPWIVQRNLASRILSAVLRRVNADWLKRYHHPVWLAETFVDISRFYGGCYRASNWVHVGQTKGWSKRGSRYSFHGQVKAVFVYPLHRQAVERLRDGSKSKQGEDGVMTQPEAVTLDFEKLDLQGENGLFAVLKTLVDVRKARGKRYKLEFLLACCACATLAGAKSLQAIEDWGKDQSQEDLKRLGSKYGKAANERTFSRILQQVNVGEFDRRIGEWMAKQKGVLSQGKALALDGKVIRGSGDGKTPPIQLLGAIMHDSGIVVAQTRVADKTNEIPCVKPLLQNLDIAGSVVTADALHTQKETARHIVEDKKADYYFTVKDNQPTLRKDIDDLHLEAFPPSGGND